MHENNNINQTILQDKKQNGKINPWRPKKVKSLIVADSFTRLGETKRANRIKYCGNTLIFLKNLQTGKAVLSGADFCKERLCPMCQWRKSLKVFHQVSRVMDDIAVGAPELVPVFLTLTVRNCAPERLAEQTTAIFRGWYQLTKHWTFRKIVKGWFRALEVTYNDDTDMMHPHIHAIILVDKSYFKSKNYMKTSDWVQLWRTACKLDYDPVVDIRKVKENNGKHKAVAEVAKYTLKDGDIVKDDKAIMDRLVSTYSKALRGRRLFAYGGIMKEVAKSLNMDDIENGNLVDVDGETIREDISTVIECYRWQFGIANYVKES